MAKDIRIIQVAFNVLDPDQQQLYDYVRQRPNSSGYVKRLIQRDIDGHTPITVALAQTVASDDFALEGFI